MADESTEQRAALERELVDVEKATARLTAAIAAGGELTALVTALAAYEDRRRDLSQRLLTLRTPRPTIDAARLRQQLLTYVADWRGLLRGHVGQAQQILRRLIKGTADALAD